MRSHQDRQRDKRQSRTQLTQSNTHSWWSNPSMWLWSIRGGMGCTFFPVKQAQLFPKTSWAQPGSVWSQ